MHFLLVYSIKLSCSLAVLWLFYRIVLRSLTFYDLNRWYLLGYAILSFLIPLVNIGPALDGGAGNEPLVIQFIPAIGKYAPDGPAVSAGHTAGWSEWMVIFIIMALGSLFLFIRIGFRWFALRRLRGRARLIRDGDWKIYQVDEAISPFSFGNAIYVNRDLHTEKEWEEIILHEYVHVRQRHTVDIVFGEWLTMLNWYNPFAWLIRHSIRQNLEFIADRKVLDNGCDKKGYQYHLLKVIGQPQYRLANNFNFSSLKKRIVMMNKLRSARLHLVKFLFILPLLAVLLVAFRDHYDLLGHRRGDRVYLNAAGIVITLPDRLPAPGVTVREQVTGLETTTDANGFFKLHIPAVTGSPLRVHLSYIRQGYDSTYSEWTWQDIQKTAGLLGVGQVIDRSRPQLEGFMPVPNYSGDIPADPDYRDALNELHRELKQSDDVHRYLATQKAHPEVALFYTTEDKEKEIVVHGDGSSERYGYPGTLPMSEFNRKYGPLPQFMLDRTHTAGAGYLARWAAISAQAGKDFHTTNPRARAIIFPGDSRVIAVDGSGKARFYDMDNDDPNERGAFEATFGRLPDCVPAGFHYPEMSRRAPRNDTSVLPRRDTLSVMRKEPVRDTFRVTGKDTLSAMKDDPGRKKDNEIIHFSSWPPQPPPLFVVDGAIKDSSVLRTLNPRQIESINVLKDSAAEARYGPRGKYGVILIKMKPARPPKPGM